MGGGGRVFMRTELYGMCLCVMCEVVSGSKVGGYFGDFKFTGQYSLVVRKLMIPTSCNWCFNYFILFIIYIVYGK